MDVNIEQTKQSQQHPCPQSDPFNATHQDQLAIIESGLGGQNPYIFLRSTWKMHSDPNAPLDDRFDRLNKIVGMLKSHVKVNTSRELIAVASSADSQQPSSREIRALEMMNRALMEKQQFRTRVSSVEEDNKKLRKTNEQLQNLIRVLQDDQSQKTKKIKNLTKLNVQMENRMLQNTLRESKAMSRISMEDYYMKSPLSSLRQSNQLPTFSEKIGNYRQQCATEEDGVKIPIVGRNLNFLNLDSQVQHDQQKNEIMTHRANISEKQNSCFFEGEGEPKRDLMHQKSLQKLRLRTRNDSQTFLGSPIKCKFIRTNTKQQLKNGANRFSTTRLE